MTATWVVCANGSVKAESAIESQIAGMLRDADSTAGRSVAALPRQRYRDRIACLPAAERRDQFGNV